MGGNGDDGRRPGAGVVIPSIANGSTIAIDGWMARKSAFRISFSRYTFQASEPAIEVEVHLAR